MILARVFHSYSWYGSSNIEDTHHFDHSRVDGDIRYVLDNMKR